MTTINLRDFYYWYTQDEFIEVSDEVAAELIKGNRHDKAHERQMYRYKAHYTLDANNGIEASAIVHSTDSPVVVLEMKERFCRLCAAPLILCPKNREEELKHIIFLGMDQRDIARVEGVDERKIRLSISKGLTSLKKIYENNQKGGPTTPENCQGY